MTVFQRSWPVNDRRALAVIVAAFFTGYALYGLVRHWHFGSSAFDLGIFDQAVWHLSRFEAPASTINGFKNLFGDHFSPIIALWAPLYWIAPAAETLVLSQALLFAASIVPVFLFLRDRLSRRLALALSIAYGLFWGLQRAMAFDVHEFAFAPLVIATAILAVDRQQWRLFWVCMGGLLLIKEDLIPLIGGFGLLLLIRGQPRHGYLAIGGSILAFAAVIGWVIPSFNPAGAFPYAGAFQAVLEQPSSIPLSLVTPIEKVRTILLWLGPFVFTSILSPFALLIPPIAVERLLSSSPNHWGGAFHYSAPLAPIIAMSAGDGLARLQRALTVCAGSPRVPHGGHGYRVRKHRAVRRPARTSAFVARTRVGSLCRAFDACDRPRRAWHGAGWSVRRRAGGNRSAPQSTSANLRARWRTRPTPTTSSWRTI